MSRQGCQNPGENSNSAGFSPLALIETGTNFGRFFQVPGIELAGDRQSQSAPMQTDSDTVAGRFYTIYIV